MKTKQTASADDSQFVLIAEDDVANRSVLEKFLSMDGYAIFSADNGVEALRLFGDHADNIGLCLIDANMPELDGLSVIREIRAKDASLPVFLLTGEADRQAPLPTAELRITRHFVKPFDWQELRGAVASVMSGRAHKGT
ncbi:MAG: response regulator [Myxococcales bacterium]|nr:MAG: response regulator [Myxococcales bacterium]